MSVTSLIFLLLSNLAFADIAIITHPDNKVDLSIEDIRLRFLGKHLNKESAAIKITPINLPFGHPSRAQFDRMALDKSEANIRTYWARMIFTSRARPPLEFNTETQVIQFVKTHPESIAYIDSKLANKGVKVLMTFSPEEKKAFQ